MARDIYYVTLQQYASSDEAVYAIVVQLRKHPAIVQILKPIVSPEDIRTAFKGVPKKTASSFSGRGFHH
jgi:hypothetical protein